MSAPIRWTLDKIVAAYQAEARRLGRRPLISEVPASLRGAIYAWGLKIAEVREMCGFGPEPDPEPADEGPSHVWPPETPNPHALTAAQLARELRASLRRRQRTDWRSHGFHTLGIGPRRKIRQPGPDARLLFVPPEDLARPKRTAA